MSYLENREKKNIERIKKEIFLKNNNNPYFVNQTIYSIRNEYDQFPYAGWYKGEAELDKPKIADREAGWIPKRYKEPIKKQDATLPETCFQSACSTVYPCYAQDNSYLYLNKACVNLMKQ
jgi:hypothetical protein